MFSATTQEILVVAQPRFLPDQSDMGQGYYVWAYTIQIENRGRRTVQLLNRSWHITDAGGQVQQVHGPGVVGEQPIFAPGQVFQYTSGVVLHTPSGWMAGTYEMVDCGSEEAFLIDIPAFSLDSPQQAGRPN